MGVRYPTVATKTFIGPLPASAVETIILTTPPLNLTLDFSQVQIFWYATMTAGTGTSSLIFQLRRGTSLTSPQINAANWAHTLAAASSAVMSGCYFDVPGPVAGQQYTLTVSQTGATAAGTFNDGALLAFAL